MRDCAVRRRVVPPIVNLKLAGEHLVRADGEIRKAIRGVSGVAGHTRVQHFRENSALFRPMTCPGRFGQPSAQFMKRMIPLDECVRQRVMKGATVCIAHALFQNETVVDALSVTGNQIVLSAYQRLQNLFARIEHSHHFLYQHPTEPGR